MESSKKIGDYYYTELHEKAKELGKEKLFLDLINNKIGYDNISSRLGLDNEYNQYMEKYRLMEENNRYDKMVKLISDYEVFLLKKICFDD
jgi:hypothetical protein